MAYERRLIAESVHTRLCKEPRLTLAKVASDLRVSRHTITRSLMEYLGVSFRTLQGQCLKTRAEDIRSRNVMSSKEMAYELGYNSPGAFARRLRRSREPLV